MHKYIHDIHNGCGYIALLDKNVQTRCVTLCWLRRLVNSATIQKKKRNKIVEKIRFLRT